jgi:hypothetical protein
MNLAAFGLRWSHAKGISAPGYPGFIFKRSQMANELMFVAAADGGFLFQAARTEDGHGQTLEQYPHL